MHAKKKIIQDLNTPITMDSYLVIMIMFLKESCTKINVKNELRLQGVLDCKSAGEWGCI